MLHFSSLGHHQTAWWSALYTHVARDANYSVSSQTAEKLKLPRTDSMRRRQQLVSESGLVKMTKARHMI